MRKLTVKDRKVAEKLENKLIKRGLVVAVCGRGEKSPMINKAHVLIEIKESESKEL